KPWQKQKSSTAKPRWNAASCWPKPKRRGFGDRGHANPLRFGFGQQLAAFHLGFAVDDFCFCHGFGVLYSCFLVGLGLEPRLLDLFFFERKGVLHGIGFGLSFEYAHLRLALSLLHLLSLCGFGLEFGNPYLLLLDLGLNSHLIVFLFFEQQV